MLPGMDGIEICKRLKENGCKTPVIMLTARGAEEDKILGFEVGADDYITKPFSLKELLMRVKAVLRRTQQVEIPVHEYAFDGIQLNFDEYTATKNGDPLDLSPREIEIMRLFVQNEGETIPFLGTGVE